jgi:hypothetical protein
MIELLYSGRSLVLDSPLGVEELTRRVEQAFDGTFVNGRISMMRRVRGRNSFRVVLEGDVAPTPSGARLDLRLRLHRLILAVGAVFALIAGNVAAIAGPEIPVVGGSPLLARVVAMTAVAVVVAALGSVEARIATRVLSAVAAATPLPPGHAWRRTRRGQR